jgi:tRNA A37 threonylcarbamoyladenosine modification protein TsaB
VIGIRSVEAIAAQLHASGHFGEAAIVIDAQRDEIYLERYSIVASGWKVAQPLRLAKPAEAKAIEPGAFIAGPEAPRWFPSGKVMVPEAGALGRLACGRNDFVPAAALEPIYMREVAFVKAPRVIDR